MYESPTSEVPFTSPQLCLPLQGISSCRVAPSTAQGGQGHQWQENASPHQLGTYSVLLQSGLGLNPSRVYCDSWVVNYYQQPIPSFRDLC